MNGEVNQSYEYKIACGSMVEGRRNERKELQSFTNFFLLFSSGRG
jgi:hypothetical protein